MFAFRCSRKGSVEDVMWRVAEALYGGQSHGSINWLRAALYVRIDRKLLFVCCRATRDNMVYEKQC